MAFYLLLNRLGWPFTYVGKVMLISFIGVHIPMIGAVSWILVGTSLGAGEVWTVVFAMLGATLVGAGVTLVCLHAMIRPVGVASASISNYLKAKDVPSLPTHATDEVGVLLSSIQEGITRLDAAVDAADARADRAVEDKRDKFKLLSGLSHEFRTPLNHIIGFAEMMSSELLGPIGKPSYKDYAGDIGSSGNQLLDRVQAVLELADVEAAAEEMTLEAVNLAAMVKTATALAHLHAERTGAIFILDVPREIVVVADRRALKQMLLHALHRVIEGFGPEKTVRLEASVSAGTCILRMTHPGEVWGSDDVPVKLIAPGDQRLQKDGRTNPGGIVNRTATALYLSLIDSLAVRCGGKLQVTSDGGKGRTMIVTLPIASPPLQSLAA